MPRDVVLHGALLEGTGTQMEKPLNESVTVIWKLAYGRRYIRHFGRMGADEASQSSGGRWRAWQSSHVDSCAPSALALPQGQEPAPGHEC